MLNWRVLSIGGILMGMGSLFDRAATVPIDFIATFFTSISLVSLALVIIGVIIIALGLFWGRWYIAIIAGAVLALGMFLFISMT